MSFFGKILDKLGFHHTDKPAVTSPVTKPSAPVAATNASSVNPSTSPINVSSSTPSTIQPAPISVNVTAPSSPTSAPIDVGAHLDSLSATHNEKLNWKASIVDLLKLLGLDSSFASRKELATELDCPTEKMNDSAQMNMWLHKTVLQKLAQNGGKIPAELLI